jgi:hypothetical protein
MVTYYQGHTIRITHEVIEVWWPDYRRFAIADLHEVYVCRGDADPAAIRSIGAACVAVVVFVGSWSVLHSIGALVVGVLLSAAAVAYGSSAFRLYPTPFELRATYRGDHVRIWYTRDALTFGQVKRALVRAMEALEN